MKALGTLNETLAALGFRTSDAGHGRRRIRDATGSVVCVGRAENIWAWLHRADYIETTGGDGPWINRR